ncbi:PIN domain-containing protein [Candidatus Magnetomoraceae bacterium gMMP-15]
MKIQRIYTDTSVIGGCFDEEFLLWSNGLMKDFSLGNFKPVVSEIVSAEIEEAPEHVKKQYAKLLSLNPEVLEVAEESLELAEAYQLKNILTPKFYDDGLHIALASVSEVDVLVSWNFKHIVHFDKIRLFNAVNLELGYKQLQIYSPREVTNYEETEYKNN